MSKVNWIVERIDYDRYPWCDGLRPLNEFHALLRGKPNEPIVDFIECQKELQEIMRGGKKIKRVIFHDPATIILWTDGSKTVVKVQDGEKYNKERGFLFCYLKGIVGNKTLLKELDKWVGNE